MKVYEVTVVKKGCNSLEDINVVTHSQSLSKNEKEKIIRNLLTDEVVFVSPSDQACCKFAYFIKGKEVLFSIIGLTAAILVGRRFFPDYCVGKSFELETVQSVFTLEVMTTNLLDKDTKFIQRVNRAITLDEKPYWNFNNSSLNGYSNDYVLLEVPSVTPFITKSSFSSNFLQSSIIPRDNINELGESLLNLERKMKFRMQIKYNEPLLDTLLITLYIQDLDNGHMTRMDVMTVNIREIIN